MRYIHSYPRILSQFLLLILFVLCCGSLTAQISDDVTITPLDFRQSSGLRTDTEVTTWMYFADTLFGFRRTNTTSGSQNLYYRTVDGGNTWESISQQMVHTPLRRLDQSTLLSLSDGYTSTDNGLTWNKPALNFGSPELDNSYVFGAAAHSVNQVVARLGVGISYYDSSLGMERSAAAERLGFTTNGGSTWVVADSAIVRTVDNQWKASITRNTLFGPLPAPPEFTSPTFGWLRVVDWPEDNEFRVVSYVQQKINDTLRSRFYLGRIDLNTMTADWSPLPMWNDIDPYKLDTDLSQFMIVSPSVFFVKAFRYETIGTSKLLRIAGAWRSIDGGTTWELIEYPSWLTDVQFPSSGSTVQFFSSTFGITTEAVTYDAGKTWLPRLYPFSTWLSTRVNGNEKPLFTAIDSSHYFFTNGYSLFAKSSDAGVTWERSGTGPNPLAMLAYDGNVLIGRSYRSLLQSSDYGENWSDIGRDSKLPDDLSVIWGLDRPDPVGNPDLILGLASYQHLDSERTTGIIVSTDGGSTWTSRASTGLKNPANVGLFTFKRFSDANGSRGFAILDGYLYRSDDDGVTWTLTGPAPAGVVMLTESAGVAATTSYTGRSYYFYTENGGGNWEPITGIPDTNVSVLGLQAVSPSGIRMVLRSKINGSPIMVYKPSYGIPSWQLSTSSAPGSTIPAGKAVWGDTASLYIFNDYDIYYSSNGGSTFDSTKIGFSPTMTGNDGKYIYAVTAGNIGVRIRIATALSSVPVPVQQIGLNSSLRTNPVQADAVVELQLPAQMNVQLRLYDMRGAFVREFPASTLSEGRHEIHFNVSDLSPGIYSLVVNAAGSLSTLKIAVVR